MNLSKAIAAFIDHGMDRGKMDVEAWASTFGCGLEDVRGEFDRQMSIKSQSPDNTCQIPEGK